MPRLGERVARLERLISRNSGNSSMPPSTDDLPGKKPPERRAAAGRRPQAGQAAGRAGRVPGLGEHPDKTEDVFPGGQVRVRR